MKIRKHFFYLSIALLLMGAVSPLLGVNPGNETCYRNILITNDNGIKDLPLLVTLAKAVRKVADNVIVVVANQERSGTSNQITVSKRGFITSDCVMADPENHIWVYAADGYPADCVILGALGILEERGAQADLVISGINGGANEGPDWFGSGTVGAARTAAFMGIPAIAVSGIHKRDPVAQKSVSQWVAGFIKTEMVRNIEPLEYFTVSVPRNLEKIKGAKIVERDVSIINLIQASLVRENKSPTRAGQKDYWTLSLKPAKPGREVRKGDSYYYMKDYITVIPMSIDENNYSLQEEKKSLETQLPAFKIVK